MFGIHDPLSTSPNDTDGSITFVCGTDASAARSGDLRTPVKSARIQISAGSSGSFDRSMSGGGTLDVAAAPAITR